MFGNLWNIWSQTMDWWRYPKLGTGSDGRNLVPKVLNCVSCHCKEGGEDTQFQQTLASSV